MKKIMMLGGSAQQVVAIETAKRLGYYTVLCDYLDDNPGQYEADKFYLVSTTDKDAVMQVALRESVDGILAYASDPAAPTAAYVAEKLGLPGNPYRSVEILCNKDLFRKFLKEHDFCTPEADGYAAVNDAVNDCRRGRYRFPVISKPVDSSGSKGVVKIERAEELKEKLSYSMSYSRNGRIVVEEYVEKYGYQVAGDGLSVDGKLVFRCFANDHFNPRCRNPFVPISASFPYNMSEEVQAKIHGEIQRLITLLGMKTCTYNFDIRIDKDFNVFLMEVAPRDGGNYIPQIIRYATGVDLVECSVRAAMGEELSDTLLEKTKNIPDKCAAVGQNVMNKHTEISGAYWSYYAVHSLEDGILKKLEIQPDIRKEHIVENHLLKKSGDFVSAFTGANTTLGCLIMKFKSMEEMLDMMEHSEKWIRLDVEPENNIRKEADIPIASSL